MSESDIVALTPMEHVRKRPVMYLGGIGSQALHHLVDEVMDNAIDEVLNNHCTHIWLTLYDESRVTVRDNSQGLRVDENLEARRNNLEVAMTLIGVGYNPVKYRVMGGLHGIGLQAVNALSSECTAEVARDGFLWRQSYQAGVPQTPVEQVRPLAEGESTGTTITFTPDFTILEQNEFDYEGLAKRSKEIAYLIPGLTVTLRDERNNAVREEIFHTPNGLADWTHALNAGKTALHEVVYTRQRIEIIPKNDLKQPFVIEIDVAFQYVAEKSTTEITYVNTVQTKEGGTHRRGFYAGLWRALKREYKQHVSWSQLRPGLTMIVSILHPMPSFESMTRVKLLNTEVEQQTARVVKEALLNHPEALAAIVRRLETSREE